MSNMIKHGIRGSCFDKNDFFRLFTQPDVLEVFPRWKEKGSVSYGFLLKVQ